jgi:butyryl-CoA dehydrogenase
MADIKVKIDAGRLLLYKAAYLKQQGKPYSLEAAEAKLFCSELAMHTTVLAVQFHGGYGYTRDYDVERMMRDAKITEIYEGTNQIQRVLIAKSAFLR